jgi:lysophospholipase L1-like esterase
MSLGNPFRRARRLLIAACGALAVSLAPATMVAAHADEGQAPYYLSLGDSLAQGVQPVGPNGASIPTNMGYVDDLYATERVQVPDLQLMKLGCPGETTGTMITGGICTYSTNPKKNNQLAAAMQFLRTHNVILVTIDIGGNNVDDCVSTAGINSTCLTNGISSAQSDLAQILARLQQAARPNARIIGMNYYDAFLAAWFQAPALAIASEDIAVNEFNPALDADYRAFGIPVADVQDAFQTTDFSPVPPTGVPTNVLEICALTWMCTATPPNIHANDAGYAVIAQTFAQTIGRLG